jgi:hypothetical protein
MMSLFAFRPGREDPRDAVDYWDFGYDQGPSMNFMVSAVFLGIGRGEYP